MAPTLYTAPRAHVRSGWGLSPVCPPRGSSGRPRSASPSPDRRSMPDERACRTAPTGEPECAGRR